MKVFVTITGIHYHFGSKPFAVGQRIKLVKEPDNCYDKEAIRAELPGLGCVGYVANSPRTVLGDCLSGGRLYDKIGKDATAKVEYVLDGAAICKVKLTGIESLCKTAAHGRGANAAAVSFTTVQNERGQPHSVPHAGRSDLCPGNRAL